MQQRFRNASWKSRVQILVSFLFIVLEDPSTLTKSFLCLRLKGMVLFWPQWKETLVLLAYRWRRRVFSSVLSLPAWAQAIYRSALARSSAGHGIYWRKQGQGAGLELKREWGVSLHNSRGTSAFWLGLLFIFLLPDYVDQTGKKLVYQPYLPVGVQSTLVPY